MTTLEGNDIEPPWGEFPNDDPEDWMDSAHEFLERMGLDEDPVEREAYLRRYPAPHTWARWVLSILGEDDTNEDMAETLARLEARGLIAVDAAYTYWCRQNPD